MEENQRLLNEIDEAKGSTDPAVLNGLLTRAQSHLRSAFPQGSEATALERAAQIQTRMVPTKPVSFGSLTIEGLYYPSEGYCSGDWWTANSLGGGNGLVVIGDVTGHGTGPALIASMVKGACDLARMGMRSSLKSSQLASMLNVVLHQTFAGEYLMTAITALWNESESTFSLTNAGHRWALIVVDGQTNNLSGPGSPPLGSMMTHRYEESSVKLSPGQRLILFTDGVVECARISDDEEFGDKRLMSLLEPLANAPASEVLEAVKQAVLAHRGSEALDDDVTMVIIDRSTS